MTQAPAHWQLGRAGPHSGTRPCGPNDRVRVLSGLNRPVSHQLSPPGNLLPDTK